MNLSGAIFDVDDTLTDLRNFFSGLLPFLALSFVVVTLFIVLVGPDAIHAYALQLQEQYTKTAALT